MWSRVALQFPRRGPRYLAFLALCFIAYWPAFDNGFISDDYTVLDTVETWRQDFTYLFKVPPEPFRLTSYALLRLLNRIFGYNATPYYVATALVHFVNVLLLGSLVSQLAGSRAGALAALLFAVLQNPNEAVMWLAASHELILGFCALVSLLLWIKKRFTWGLLFFAFAIFSKESGVAIAFLLPVTEWWGSKKIGFRREYAYLTLALATFAALFLYTAPGNFMIRDGTYTLGLHGGWVLVKSLHKLCFPWLYLAFIVAALRRWFPEISTVGPAFAWMVLALSPYVFLTYQNHVPSRHMYLASMGLVSLLAIMISRWESKRWSLIFVLAFVLVNISYLWFRKDAQFEERAAPTERLVEEMRRLPPQPVLVQSFPLNPWFAKLSARVVPGWKPDLVNVNEFCVPCVGYPRLVWNEDEQKYFIR